jgi:hypothetical protein
LIVKQIYCCLFVEIFAPILFGMDLRLKDLPAGLPAAGGQVGLEINTYELLNE